MDEGSKGRLTIKRYNLSEDKLQILYGPIQATNQSKPFNLVIINKGDDYTVTYYSGICFYCNVVAVVEGAEANLQGIKDSLEFIGASETHFGFIQKHNNFVR